MRLDRVRFLTYIDDLVFFVPESCKEEGDALMKRYVEAVRDFGWKIKDSKVTPLTLDPVRVLGYVYEVSGASLTITPEPTALGGVVAATGRLLEKGRACGPGLSELVGSWIWMLLLRRSTLSVLSANTFDFAAKVFASRSPVALPKVVADELRMLMALAPLLRVSMADGWDDHLFATDASTAGCGVVSTTLPPGQGAELLRFHGWTVSRDPRATTQAAVVYAEAVQRGVDWGWGSMLWKTLVSHAWGTAQHINRLEFAALNTTVRRAVSGGAVSVRLPVLSDSSVVIGAATKGRSGPLLRPCRVLGALLLASDLTLILVFVPTEQNPADPPSRGGKGFSWG